MIIDVSVSCQLVVHFLIDEVFSQVGFNKRCEHERRRLLLVERKIIAFERHLAMVRDDLSDDVVLNYTRAPVNNALGMGSSDNSPRSSLLNNIEFRDDWIFR